MSKAKKITIFSLLFLILGIIFLGLWSLKIKISDPFKPPEDNSYQLARSDQLDQSVDTDGDGLSDYDETFLYGTSPYLEDTDGDGISDYDEIMRGSDPTCPEGGDCLMSSDFFAEAENETNYSEDILNDFEQSLGAISLPENVNEIFLQQVLSGEIVVQDLRELLIESGANQELIEQISDEELLSIYQETLNNKEQ